MSDTDATTEAVRHRYADLAINAADRASY